MQYPLCLLLVLLAVSSATVGLNIVVTNDDGWAVAMIRAQVEMLWSLKHAVVLSAPAINKSGSGRSTTKPVPLTEPCGYNSCPVGSPAIGYNACDPFLNYVNGFPVDAVRHGIRTRAPELWNGLRPDLVISGMNVGNNLSPSIITSGTVGAAAEAVLNGVPAIAISGATAAHVSSADQAKDPNSKFSRATKTYNTLTSKFLATLLDHPGPILPPGIVINLNYPGTENCPTAADIKFVFTRVADDSKAADVRTCGTNHLTDELTAIRLGCYATVSVFNASTIADVDASHQRSVLKKLAPILTCLRK